MQHIHLGWESLYVCFAHAKTGQFHYCNHPSILPELSRNGNIQINRTIFRFLVAVYLLQNHTV